MKTEGDVQLHPTKCAICSADDQDDELYPASFKLEALNPVVFSARRLPDRVHYRIVRCRICGLVRSNPTADPALLKDLYSRSSFTYASEVPNLKRTYAHCLRRVGQLGGQQRALLEIGCGSGFFLREALEQGFASVWGVEPSTDAVAMADQSVQPFIVCDIMRPGLFSASEFDVVCMFQVLDHLPDPGSVLDECLAILKPGGFVLCATHNVEGVSARLLAERSPIIDIEHTYLYSPKTMTHLLAVHGFQVVEVQRLYNYCTLQHLTSLLPVPKGLKALGLRFLRVTGLGGLRLRLPLGNLYAIARRPEDVTAEHRISDGHRRTVP